MIEVLKLIGGATILFFGAEWLIGGSSTLARSFGVRPLVVGLTLVAYGTSAPEFAVSVAAAYEKPTELVIGNVVGSCVANLALVLGITALLKPPQVDRSIPKVYVPFLLLAVGGLCFVAWDGIVTRLEAGFMLSGAVAFSITTLIVALRDRQSVHVPDEVRKDAPKRLPQVGLALLGLVMLVGGAEIFVDGARAIALELGMSERYVGLTVVAVGTSLPELAASVVAAMRGVSDIAVGGVVGSNIFNGFLIVGVAGLVTPLPVGEKLGKDLIFLGAVTVLGALFMRRQRAIRRLEGGILVTAYVTFIVLASVDW